MKIKRANITTVLHCRSSLYQYMFGYIVYFFEKACPVGGYLLDVNLFNQLGFGSLQAEYVLNE